MKPQTVPDAHLAVLALQDEIRRSGESRYDHRLHRVRLVAQGMSCRQAATAVGDAPRTVEYWVRAYGRGGLAGLREKPRSGRPPRLTAEQLKPMDRVLRQPPESADITANRWDGKSLAAFLDKRWPVHLGVRQCQRLFRSLGFRLCKPRPEIAYADPEAQKMHKKTPSTDGRP
jgi:transposase